MAVFKLARTGAAPVDSASFTGRSATVGAAIRGARNAVLLVNHDEERGIEHFIISPTSKVAQDAASAFGVREEEVELPVLNTHYIARMKALPASNAARETQAGADPAQAARHLSTSLPVGCWVAIAMRYPFRSEVQSSRRWYDHRLGNANTHHSKVGEAVVASIWAGGNDRSDVRMLLPGVVASLPGFDVEAVVRKPIGRFTFTFVFLLLAAIARLVLLGTEPIGPWWNGIYSISSTASWSIIAALVAIAVAFVAGVIPTPESIAKRGAAKGVFPPPRHKILPVKRPSKERTVGERTIMAKDGDYPMARTSFLVGPSVVLGIVNPNAGESMQASTTRLRKVPKVLTTTIGPLIGSSGDEAVHISQLDRFGGVAAFGKPGSGKSVLIHNLFAYDVACKVLARSARPTGVPGDTGANNTLVVFENKGADGVAVYQKLATDLGEPLSVIEVSDHSTPAIDMFPQHGTAKEKASFFADSMAYAFGEQAIMYRSKMVLTQCATVALLMNAQDIADANQVLNIPLPPDISPLEIIDILLAGRGEEYGIALSVAFFKRAAASNDHELIEAAQELSALWGSLDTKRPTTSQRNTLTQAPSSKIAVLMKNKSWWSRSRTRGSWDAIVSGHHSVVINAGQALNGTAIDDTLTKALLAMLTYGLQKSIERNCVGWVNQNRSVSIYSDELSLLAGEGTASVFEWFRNQGRSFGVRNNYATQIPEQLENVLRQTVMGMTTFFWYGQDDPGIAEQAARDLSADGSEISPADIVGMEVYHAYVRTAVNKQRQPTVVVKMGYWEDGPIEKFLSDQGLLV